MAGVRACLSTAAGLASGVRHDGAMIGRAHHVVIDCPDPEALAEFHAELVGLPVTYRSADFVVVSADSTTSGFAFQRATDDRPLRWPDPAPPVHES